MGEYAVRANFHILGILHCDYCTKNEVFHYGFFSKCEKICTKLRISSYVLKKTLTHFSPVSHFYTPWKHQKTFGFLTFSGGIEMWHWTKMGEWKTSFFVQWVNRKFVAIVLQYSINMYKNPYQCFLWDRIHLGMVYDNWHWPFFHNKCQQQTVVM